MVRRPHLYIWVGRIPASDPRTVRGFGIFYIVMGLLIGGLATSILSPD